MKSMPRLFLFTAAITAMSCQSLGSGGGDRTPREATSLLGKPLYAPTLDSATRARFTADLERAVAEAREHPDNADALIWVGRRHGYLGQYNRAIQVFSEGTTRFPSDPRMLRHRGHRYISVRQIDSAITDLTRAGNLMSGMPDQVEPDGQPNARNIPVGSLKSNVWYHLALAHYLTWNWPAAITVGLRGLSISMNPDRLVSQTHWIYMALRRAGQHEQAAELISRVPDDLDVIENHSYYTLLKLYQRGITPAVMDSLFGRFDNPTDLSLAYGLANWFLYTGDTTRAVAAFERIVRSSQWASFGYIAAEADLARLDRRRR